MAILLPLKMSPEFQMKVKDHLVVLGALVASVGQMKGPTLVQAGFFHNVVVCWGFCVFLLKSMCFKISFTKLGYFVGSLYTTY